MKRAAMLVAVVAVLVAALSGVASARTFVCDSVPCFGTDNADQIGERKGSVRDDIRARGGDDTVNAMRSGNDTDVVFGQAGDDRINTADGDSRDTVDCGAGEDEAIVDPGDTVEANCETVTVEENATLMDAA